MRVARADQPIEVLQHDIANGLEVKRASQRLAERHQAFELGGASKGLLALSLGGSGPRFCLLSFSLLMDDEDHSESDTRKDEGDAGTLLDTPR